MDTCQQHLFHQHSWILNRMSVHAEEWKVALGSSRGEQSKAEQGFQQQHSPMWCRHLHNLTALSYFLIYKVHTNKYWHSCWLSSRPVVLNDFLQAKTDTSKSQSLSFTYNLTFTLDKKSSQDSAARDREAETGKHGRRRTLKITSLYSAFCHVDALCKRKKRLW